MVWTKGRIYCATDDQWEYQWRNDGLPLTCPVDAEAHTVRSSQELATVSKYKEIDSTNSPFTVHKSFNFYACDSTNGNITLNLQPAADNSSQIIVVVKTAAANTITVDGYGSELIGGQATATLTSESSFIELLSTGSGWDILETSRTFGAGRADETTATENGDEWVFTRKTTSGIDGGDSVNGAWTQISLTHTQRDSGSDVKRSGNDITLKPGRYRILVNSIFFRTGGTRMRLYNSTDSSTEFTSLSYWIQDSGSASSTCTIMEGHIDVVESDKTFKIDYYCQLAKSGGLGKAAGAGGGDEVYTSLRIKKQS